MFSSLLHEKYSHSLISHRYRDISYLCPSCLPPTTSGAALGICGPHLGRLWPVVNPGLVRGIQVVLRLLVLAEVATAETHASKPMAGGHASKMVPEDPMSRACGDRGRRGVLATWRTRTAESTTAPSREGSTRGRRRRSLGNIVCYFRCCPTAST